MAQADGGGPIRIRTHRKREEFAHRGFYYTCETMSSNAVTEFRCCEDRQCKGCIH